MQSSQVHHVIKPESAVQSMWATLKADVVRINHYKPWTNMNQNNQDTSLEQHCLALLAEIRRAYGSGMLFTCTPPNSGIK